MVNCIRIDLITCSNTQDTFISTAMINSYLKYSSALQVLTLQTSVSCINFMLRDDPVSEERGLLMSTVVNPEFILEFEDLFL